MFSILAITQLKHAAPFELQLPTASIRANQNGSVIGCRAGISYSVYKNSLNSTPIYNVVSDENTVPYPDGNKYPFDKSYKFVHAGTYLMKLTNSTVSNSQ